MRYIILTITIALAISWPVNLVSNEFARVKYEMAERTAINRDLNSVDPWEVGCGFQDGFGLD